MRHLIDFGDLSRQEWDQLYARASQIIELFLPDRHASAGWDGIWVRGPQFLLCGQGRDTKGYH